MKQTIRLTESELRNMISESVKTILKENFADNVKTNFAYVKCRKKQFAACRHEASQNDN